MKIPYIKGTRILVPFGIYSEASDDLWMDSRCLDQYYLPWEGPYLCDKAKQEVPSKKSKAFILDIQLQPVREPVTSCENSGNYYKR